MSIISTHNNSLLAVADKSKNKSKSESLTDNSNLTTFTTPTLLKLRSWKQLEELELLKLLELPKQLKHLEHNEQWKQLEQIQTKHLKQSTLLIKIKQTRLQEQLEKQEQSRQQKQVTQLKQSRFAFLQNCKAALATAYSCLFLLLDTAQANVTVNLRDTVAPFRSGPVVVRADPPPTPFPQQLQVENPDELILACVAPKAQWVNGVCPQSWITRRAYQQYLAQQQTMQSQDNAFSYDRQEQGWFYYNWTTPYSEEEDKTQPYPVTPSSTSTPDSSLTLPLKPVPAKITVAWLRENLPHYLEAAIDNPTDQQVLAYLYLQSYANQKAGIFAEQAQLVSQGDPFLDNNAAFTNNSQARQYRDQFANKLRTKLIEMNKRNFVLLMIINNDYESLQFAKLLGYAANKYGVKFSVFDLQGRTYPSLNHLDQVSAPKQVWEFVSKHNTTTFPTLYVVDRESTAVLVAGATDLADLETRLIRYLYSKHFISRTEFNVARGIMTEQVQQESELANFINTKLGLVPHFSSSSQSPAQAPSQPSTQAATNTAQTPKYDKDKNKSSNPNKQSK